MTNSKNTKRALLTSALAILACVAMLVGTTFAWFTDSVSTGINKIQSGNLDLAVEHKVDGEWETVEGATNLFSNVDGEPILWEPGASAAETFAIRNAGNLALKYQFVLSYENATATAAGKTLADALSATILEGDDISCSAGLTDLVYEGVLLPGASREFTVGLVWIPTENDNDFNVVGGLSIDLGIHVVATQYTYEKDGFGDQYDAEAEYDMVWTGATAPVKRDENTPPTVKTLADVTDTEAKTVKIDSAELLAAFAQSVNDGNSYLGYTVTLEEDIDLANRNWTPIGKPVYNGNNVIKGAFSGNFDGQGHTVYNLKVNGGVDAPVDVNAVDQGLFGCLYAHGNMAYIQNLNIHNADVYAKNSAGAFVGNLHTFQHVYQSGQSNIWNCKLTGKVTIKGGKSGGVCGSPVTCWAILTSLQNITVDVDNGSYVSNVGVAGAGGNVASVAAIAAYSTGFKNISPPIWM